MNFLLYLQPAGLAVDTVALPKAEGLDPPSYREEKSDEDTYVAAGRASSPAAEAMLNGTESDDGMHTDLSISSSKTMSLVNENGTTEIETPHGSVTGSNGFILTKEQQQQDVSAAVTPGSGVSPLRTNRLPLGSLTGGQTAKPLIASASGCAQSSGALRTVPSTGNMLGQGTSDSKNGFASSPVIIPPPVTVHRARKTMSRPAVSPAQK
ncbi:hypothetical protein ATANTOWER_029170, partial [Ataeniobius toweri]|nr:hypothetical protein [Ataeniobius toweri]